MQLPMFHCSVSCAVIGGLSPDGLRVDSLSEIPLQPEEKRLHTSEREVTQTFCIV